MTARKKQLTNARKKTSTWSALPISWWPAWLCIAAFVTSIVLMGVGSHAETMRLLSSLALLSTALVAWYHRRIRVPRQFPRRGRSSPRQLIPPTIALWIGVIGSLAYIVAFVLL